MTVEFPHMMFRAGSQERIWNEFDCDLLIVQDEDERSAAKRDGWHDHPSCGRGAKAKEAEPESAVELAVEPAAEQPEPVESTPAPVEPPAPKPAAKRGPYKPRKKRKAGRPSRRAAAM